MDHKTEPVVSQSVVERVDVPEDARAEIQHEDQLSGKATPPTSSLRVPEEVLAEEDAAVRAVRTAEEDDKARGY